MNEIGSKLIDSLVEGLHPVRPMKWRAGAFAAIIALAATVVIVVVTKGFRTGLLTGEVAPLFVVANGLLLLLGLAAASAVVAMANPQVGSHHNGPVWAMATVALLPITAIVTTAAKGALATSTYHGPVDLFCMVAGVFFSIVVAGTLLFWLRRGAPVSIERAGLFLGVAAGALGSFAYGLSCPIETMNHLGVWHVLPVAVAGVIGRFALPRLLRW